MPIRKVVPAASLIVALALILTPTLRAVAKEHMDMAHMIEMAKTAADHEKLAKHYEEQAKAARAKAEEHRKMAEAYRKQGGAFVSKLHFDEHCDGLVKSFTAAANEYDAMAKAERDVAKETK